MAGKPHRQEQDVWWAPQDRAGCWQGHFLPKRITLETQRATRWATSVLWLFPRTHVFIHAYIYLHVSVYIFLDSDFDGGEKGPWEPACVESMKLLGSQGKKRAPEKVRAARPDMLKSTELSSRLLEESREKQLYQPRRSLGARSSCPALRAGKEAEAQRRQREKPSSSAAQWPRIRPKHICLPKCQSDSSYSGERNWD